MKYKVLVILLVTMFSACTKKVIDFHGDVLRKRPLKIRVLSYTNINGNKIEIDDYFADILTINIKRYGLNDLTIVNENADLTLVVNDDVNYFSLRAVDKSEKVRFISVHSHKRGAFVKLTEYDLKCIINEISKEFINWLNNNTKGKI